MKIKLMFLLLLLSLFLIGIAASNAHAVSKTEFWPKMCSSCHDGKTAISKEAMREKYQTADLFTVAVLNKGDRCMNILKNDKKLIKKVANEIGLK